MAEQRAGTTVKNEVESNISHVLGSTQNGAGPAGTAGAVESIELGPQVSLTIANDALNVLDRTARKHNRSCGLTSTDPSGPSARSIALYNVLWAELSPHSTTLTIDYADETAKHRLSAAKLSFPVPLYNDDDDDDDSDAATAAATDRIRAFLSTLLARAYGSAQPRKRAYVLVNPHAGPGGADKIFEKQVRPLFEAARMPLTVVTTTHTGHAVSLCRDELDVAAHDVVVACSGDGLPHECFNGLAQRADARRALGAMPVVMIPCGSGNAMACNLYGTHRASLAALAIVKGVRTPLDLVSVTQGDRRFVSFLSQAFGIVADVDLGTEHLRWMGGTRFQVGFMWLVFRKKTYPCDIAVKVEIEDKSAVREHYRARVGSLAGGVHQQHGGDGASDDATTAKTTTTRAEEAEAGEDLGLPPLKYGTVNDKVPEGWEVIPHERLGNFYCGNMAYMAPEANFFAAAMANDGLMDMVTADGDISPLKAIQMQLDVESGHFFDNPLVTYRKVSAYRITPHRRPPGEGPAGGYISIDGESVPFEPFQAEVHQGLGLTLSKKGDYEAPGPKNWDKVTNTERLLA